jgi:hypothetical protein
MIVTTLSVSDCNEHIHFGNCLMIDDRRFGVVVVVVEERALVFALFFWGQRDSRRGDSKRDPLSSGIHGHFDRTSIEHFTT